MNRYQRHQALYSPAEFERIRHAKIAVIGLGGLGSNALQLLARLGLGEIHLWDGAILDLPDLNRQTLYNNQHLGQFKAEAACHELGKINPEVKLHAHAEYIQPQTIFPKFDLVIDCLDTFAARLLLDKLFFEKGIPIIHASVFQKTGYITSLIPGKTDNYQNSFGIENKPRESNTKTIFPPLVSAIASFQVSEAINCLTQNYDQMLLNKILSIDMGNYKFEILDLK
jgi:molybdopterin/thiamine biosynthesis adenylyltransferase